MASKEEIAVFGGGCFWCTEAIFQKLRGVVSVASGYAGGKMENPTYEDVSTGATGYAEVIKIEFDPSQIGYPELLTVFFATYDPTTNRQGEDIGSQYRSIIFYTTNEQKKQAESYIKKNKAIVTELKPLLKFYEAEKYHQKYYQKNPSKAYCQLVISPKLSQLREKFLPLLK